MNRLDLYVYECTECERESVLSEESVAPPEVHLGGTEDVYCHKCGHDIEHIFQGLQGLNGGFVRDSETDDRYCPLCTGSCEETSSV